MSTYVVTIGGATKTVRPGLSIVENLNTRASVTCEADSADGSYRPGLGEEVVITEDGDTIFAGLIRACREAGWGDYGVTPIRTRVDAEDYTSVADRRYVDEAFADSTLKQILTRLVTYMAGHGITLDGSQVDGPTVTARTYTNRPISDIFNELSGETGYIWEIGYDKVLRMYEPGDVAAPFDVEDGDGHAIGDITVEPSEGKYGTRVKVLAGGSGVRELSWSETDNDADEEVNKYYGPGTTIGAFRCWNLSPLVSSIAFGSSGALKVVDGGVAAYPNGLTRLADLEDRGVGNRYFLERTFDILFDEPTDFWPLNEASGNALDAGSGAHNGTVGGSPTRNAAGVLFDGSNDKVTLASITAFSTTWSWEGVFRPNSTQSSTEGLLFGEASTGCGVRYNKTSGKIEVKGHTGSVLAESSVLVSGTTYQVFVSVTAGAIVVYLDAVSAGTGTGWTSTHTADRIGGDTGFWLKGLLRNVAYYPGVSFTANEVTSHYARTIDRLMQAASETALGSTDYIAVAYMGQYPVIATADNAAAQATRGIEEIVLQTPSLLRYDATYAMAEQALLQLATPRRVTYNTRELGIRPGMTQTIDIADRNINAECLVIQVETRNIGGSLMNRTVRATEGATLQGIWRDTFLNRITSPDGSFGGSPVFPVTPSTPLSSGGSGGSDCCPAAGVGSLAFSGFADSAMKFMSPAGVLQADPANSPTLAQGGSGCQGLVQIPGGDGTYCIAGNGGTYASFTYDSQFAAVKGGASSTLSWSIASNYAGHFYTYLTPAAGNYFIKKYDATCALIASYDMGFTYFPTAGALAVAPDGSAAYYSKRRTSSDPIRKCDMAGGFANLITKANYKLFDNALLCLPNGNLLAAWTSNTGAAGVVEQFDSAGTLVSTVVTLAAGESPICITPGLTPSETFWMSTYKSGVSTFSGVRVYEINIATGDIVNYFDPNVGTFEFDGPFCVVRKGLM